MVRIKRDPTLFGQYDRDRCTPGARSGNIDGAYSVFDSLASRSGSVNIVIFNERRFKHFPLYAFTASDKLKMGGNAEFVPFQAYPVVANIGR